MHGHPAREMTRNDCVRSGFSGNGEKIKTKMFGHDGAQRFRVRNRGFHSLPIASAQGQSVVENRRSQASSRTPLFYFANPRPDIALSSESAA
jgi:hypothetical protein